MSKTKQETASGCLVRAGGTLGALSVAVRPIVVRAVWVSALWSFVDLVAWPVRVVLRVMPGAVACVSRNYFAGLLATSAVSAVMCALVFKLDLDVTEKGRPLVDCFGAWSPAGIVLANCRNDLWQSLPVRHGRGACRPVLDIHDLRCEQLAEFPS